MKLQKDNYFCLSAATDVCIARLIDEELLPLQQTIANGSSLLNFADRQSVSVHCYIVLYKLLYITLTTGKIT